MGIGAGLYMYDVVVKKFMFAVSSPDEFLFTLVSSVLLSTLLWFDTVASMTGFWPPEISSSYLKDSLFFEGVTQLEVTPEKKSD